MMARQQYADRDHAGRVLAAGLTEYAGHGDVVVLGLPRGGVPVAAVVAEMLPAPLDVLVVRKLGLPGQPELAMGAVAGVGDDVELVRNERVLASVQVSDDDFTRLHQQELAELALREAAYREGRDRVSLAGRVVILVDDGLATGSTMRAAVAAVRRQGPSRLVVAVPVGDAETCEALRQEVDDVVCPLTPEPFIAVGQAYDDFGQTSDGQVRRALATANPPA